MPDPELTEKKVVFRAQALTKSYGSHTALHPLDLELRAGEITALIGANGAGKSTLLRMISSLLSPSGGRIQLDARVGYLSGDTRLYDRLTPRETLEFFAHLHGLSPDQLQQRVDLMVEKMQLAPFLEKPVGALSTGMRQRVNIARALIHDPELILLDEATTALDFTSAAFIVDYLGHLRRQGKSLLFSTHILSEADFLADRVVVLKEGRKISDTTKDELLTRTDTTELTSALLKVLNPKDAAQLA